MEGGGRAGAVNPVGLRAAVYREAGTRVGIAVTVQGFALEMLRDADVVVPGLRRLQAVLLEKVRPVVDHLKVAVERDRVGVPLAAGAEGAEERRDVAPLQGGVALDSAASILALAKRALSSHPLAV